MSARFVSVTQTLFQRALRFILVPILRVEILGDINALNGSAKPIIIAANHSARIDPFLLTLLPFETMARLKPLAFPTTENYYKRLLYRMWIAPLGAYPIPTYATNVDEFLGETIDKLKSGFTVMLFPEGRLVAHKGQARAKTGVIICSKRTGAHITPLYIEGSPSVSWKNVLTRKVRIVITVRKPFSVNLVGDDTETHRKEAERLLDVIYGA